MFGAWGFTTKAANVVGPPVTPEINTSAEVLAMAISRHFVSVALRYVPAKGDNAGEYFIINPFVPVPVKLGAKPPAGMGKFVLYVSPVIKILSSLSIAIP